MSGAKYVFNVFSGIYEFNQECDFFRQFILILKNLHMKPLIHKIPPGDTYE